MTRNKLNKLRRELNEMRRSPQKAIALQSLAQRLGRKAVVRGKEPTWDSDVFMELRPLAIPDHGGKDMAIGTKNSILNQLEDDLNAWEEQIAQEEAKKANGVI